MTPVLRITRTLITFWSRDGSLNSNRISCGITPVNFGRRVRGRVSQLFWQSRRRKHTNIVSTRMMSLRLCESIRERLRLLRYLPSSLERNIKVGFTTQIRMLECLNAFWSISGLMRCTSIYICFGKWFFFMGMYADDIYFSQIWYIVSHDNTLEHASNTLRALEAYNMNWVVHLLLQNYGLSSKPLSTERFHVCSALLIKSS
jgi:hypothetical protein